MRRKGIRVLIFGLLPIAGLLIGNAIVSELNTRRIVENEGWVSHTLQVLGTLESIHRTVSEAEAAQRGYLITGDADYLDSFEAAADAVSGQVDQLKAFVSDNSTEGAYAGELDVMVRARLERLQRTIDARQAQGPEAAYRIVESDNGEQIMRRIHAQIALMEEVENGLLAQRSADSQQSLRLKSYTNALGALIGVLATVLAFVLFQRMLRQRSRQEAQARARAAREKSLGELRQYALSDADLDSFMDRAVHLIARTLDVPLVKILELLPGQEDFLLRAGIGWKEGLVGRALVSGAIDSQAGYTLHASRPSVAGDLTTYEPVVVDDLEREQRFSGPPLLREHGAVSGVSVIIHDRPGRPFGVLGAHSVQRRTFTEEEAQFLQVASNVLAVAIQRRRAEESLRDSESRFRALAESVPGVVWTSLPDGQCDYVNQHLSETTGLSVDESLGLGWTTALHEEDKQRSIDRWLHCMETGEPFECEYRFRMKGGGYRWWLGRALPLRDAGGHIVKWFGHCADIEDRKRMEAELLEADQRKDQFLAMLGHELRNPLAPIANIVALLRMRPGADQDLKQDADVIDRQVLQMTRLLDDLLDASRIGRGEIRLDRHVVEVADILARAVEVARPWIEERHHDLETAIPAESIHLEADGARLIQSVVNLLINAAKYTPPGGHIRLVAERQEDEAVIRVRDDGVGIPGEMLPRIFEMFTRVDQPGLARDGLGIGLALVKKLVELHGGSLEASSAGQGSGSEFTIRLPALVESDRGPKREEGPGSAPTIPRCRVLVVDDNGPLADTFVRLLQADGCDPRVAADGETALRMALEFEPDVIFVDLGLPDMNGYEVARRLRSQPALKDALLVAMTGYGRSGVERVAEKAGFQHCLVKPVRIEAVERLLLQHQGPAA